MKRENIKLAADLDNKIEAIQKVIDRLKGERPCKKINLDFGGTHYDIVLSSIDKIKIVIDALVIEMKKQVDHLNKQIEEL